MANIFGRMFTRRELLRHVGDIGQVAGVRLSELNDGPGRGVRTAELTTGGGLTCTVLIDRGFDIGAASLDGIPLMWQSATGVTHPAFYEPDGAGWLRSFGGGLLATCGLTNVGLAGRDDAGAYGVHGRVSNLPAHLLRAEGEWTGDDYSLTLAGELREAAVFGFNLRLTRQIRARLGENRITLNDTIENHGDRAAPLMLLYHCNFGFPLVAAGSEILIDAPSTPRDAQAALGLAHVGRIEAPQAGFAEQVFYYTPAPATDGFVTAAIMNRNLRDGMAAYVRYRQAELPNLVLWKQFGAGIYAVGIEPANCLVMGRADERARGTLQQLDAGERCSFQIELGAGRGAEELAAIERMVKHR